MLDSANNLILGYGFRVRAISPAGVVIWTTDLLWSVRALALDTAGNIYVTGLMNEPGGSSLDLMVMKITAGGQLVWTRNAGLANAVDEGSRIAVDDQGGIYAAGYSIGTSMDLFLVKYDTDGVLQWTRRFNGSSDLQDKASGLVAMPGGGVVVCGITRNPDEQFITIRYSASGSAQWVAYYNAPGEMEGVPCGIVRTTDGALAVSGISGPRTVATVKYSAAGTQLWANRTELSALPSSTEAFAIAITAGPDGGAAVLGSIYVNPNFEFSVVSVQSGGLTGWRKVIRSIPPAYAGYESAPVITTLPGGGYVAAAGISSYNSSHTGAHARLTAIDAAGEGLTEVEWPDPGVMSQLSCSTLRTGSDGSVWAVASDRGELTVKRFGAVPASGPPVVAPGGVENLQITSVRLKGTVNPNGALTNYHYEYGTTTAYGQSTPVRTLPGGGIAIDASEAIAVSPGQSYHFRLVATNANGTALGAEQTFTVPLSAYQTWIVNAFGSLEVAGSGPTDDPDHDNAGNLVEYVFGGNALVTGRLSGLPVFSFWESPDSGIVFPGIVYRPDPSRTDVTITPVASNDLVTWTNAGIVVTELPDGSRRAVAQGLQRFMRLRLTSP